MDLSPFSAAVANAVVAGENFGVPEQPADDEQERVIPGTLVRNLVLGVHGDLSAPAVRIHGVVIEGDIDLAYREWRGELDLSHCRITGAVRLGHAVVTGQVIFDHCVIHEINAPYVQVDGPFYFRSGRCTAGLYALAARIGMLNLRQSQLWAPLERSNRCAVELFRARLGDVFLTDARVYGGVYANGITVDRNVRLQGSEILSREAMGWKTGPDSAAGAVSLVGATLGGALYISWKDPDRPNGRFDGGVVVTRMSCVSLRVRETELEAITDVDHLDYERLLGVSPEEWLAKLSRARPVATQPFAQFAAYAAGIGRADLQRASLIHLQHRLTSELPARSLERWRRQLWSWSVGYGYRPARSIVWLGLSAILCVGLLMLNGDFLVQQATASASRVRGVQNWTEAAAISIDNLLPFAGLGVARQWSADPRTLSQTIWLLIFVVLKFVGWGMAAVGLASVTGVMKRASS